MASFLKKGIAQGGLLSSTLLNATRGGLIRGGRGGGGGSTPSPMAVGSEKEMGNAVGVTAQVRRWYTDSTTTEAAASSTESGGGETTGGGDDGSGGGSGGGGDGENKDQSTMEKYLSLFPEPGSRRRPKPSSLSVRRAERGSYADVEIERYLQRLPEHLRESPIGGQELNELTRAADALEQAEDEERMRDIASAIAGMMSSSENEEDEEDGGSGPLHWTTKVVIGPGKMGVVNPLNRKVKAWFHILDLQHHYKLSDDATARIIRLAGPRYNPTKGTVTITSDSRVLREENKAEVLRIILGLVQEVRV